MFDLYLMHIVGNGINYYKSNRTLFDPLFPHVASAMRDRMWNTLQNETVSFESSFQPRTAGKLPLITIQSSEQFYEQQGLGQHGGVSGEEIEYAHIFTSQEAVINIYTESIETVRLLQTIIQASVLLFKDILVQGGFQNILYIGANPLIPEVALRGESLATYGRQLRYNGLHLLEIPLKIEQLDNIGASDIKLDTINVQGSSNSV